MQEMLKDIRVLDFTNNLAGPGAAATLADYGAEVIHIEKPVSGDDSRFFSPLIDGMSTSYLTINRNKKSVVLDLKDSAAIEIIRKMIRDTDVLIESFRPGVMDRLGLGYDAVSAIKPDIIYCSISIYGHRGPYAGKAGYDVIAQAFSGIMNYTGSEESGPTKIGVTIGDGVGMLNAYASIMTALFHRQRTGEGQRIDISLARGLIWLCSEFNHTVIPGYHRKRMGNHDPQLCPYGIFRGPNDESIVIGAVNANLWKKLCAAMERPEFADDPRFCTNNVRVDHSEEVNALIEGWLNSLPSIAEAAKRLDAVGVPNCKVYSYEDLAKDPHVLACGWLKGIPTPSSITSADEIPFIIGNADFSKATARVEKAPDLGENNYEILSQYGLTQEEIDSLERKWSLPH